MRLVPNDLATDRRVGRVVGERYLVEARLASGSMGTVYRARDLEDGRKVALKVVRSERDGEPEARARFAREARVHEQLCSPHTVRVLEWGETDEGLLFLAMELLEGESLGARLARVGRLTPAQAVGIALQALDSLADAHARGIVHRDLKPDNLFFTRCDFGIERSPGEVAEMVKVLDFGIAKLLKADEGPGAIDVLESQAGAVFGTPRYMSPEQAQAKDLDGRSDLYSMGAILYQMVTGRAPFTDDDAVVVMARHIKTPPRAPSLVCPDASIPAELEAVILSALAKDPAQRPADAIRFGNSLLRALRRASRGGADPGGAALARLSTHPHRLAWPVMIEPDELTDLSWSERPSLQVQPDEDTSRTDITNAPLRLRTVPKPRERGARRWVAGLAGTALVVGGLGTVLISPRTRAEISRVVGAPAPPTTGVRANLLDGLRPAAPGEPAPATAPSALASTTTSTVVDQAPVTHRAPKGHAKEVPSRSPKAPRPVNPHPVKTKRAPKSA